MRKKILASLAIIPIVIFSTGCGLFGSSPEPETTPGTTPSTLAAISEVQNAVISQDARLTELESNTTDTTGVTTLQADLAKLRSDFDAFVAATTGEGAEITGLESAIADLNARITALETPATTAETTCRWYCEVYNLNHLNLLPDGVTPEVEIDYSTSPSKIQDADDYTVYVDINNNTTTAIQDLQVEITFTPKTGANVIVNEDNLYLDSATSPYYIWEMEVSTKSDETCRRITFSTDGVKVPKGVVVDSTITPGLTHLKLTFTLAYQ